MITAPAPIIAPARPTWASLSIISALASSISLPSSFASWAKASLTSSGMERLLAEFIAISPVLGLRPVAGATGHAATGAAPGGAAAAAAIGIVGEIRRAGICRALGGALQETHHGKADQHRYAEECGRLTTRKRLHLLHQVLEVAVPDRVGDVVDLRGGFPHIAAGDGNVVVELPRRAAQRVGKIADIFGADVLLPFDRLLQLIGGLRGHVGRHVLGRIHQLRG